MLEKMGSTVFAICVILYFIGYGEAVFRGDVVALFNLDLSPHRGVIRGVEIIHGLFIK